MLSSLIIPLKDITTEEKRQIMAQYETAIVANGCFWCTEAVFKRLKGVISVVPGYAASKVANPSYQQVCTGRTGAAEGIKITYDPAIISYEKLLEIFWHLHDPTTLNRQGNDVGTQYRSGIYYQNDEQKRIALAVKESLEKAHTYKDPIVTEIVPFTNFYQAEDYHHDYYDNNRYQPYCRAVIDPKVRKLLKEYSSELKETGVK
jgi:peptide-methionine (S)-S-oxide reductase